MANIICLGLNPSQQITLQFHKVELGSVNRAEKKSVGVGGKGQNFAVAAQQYSPSRVTLLQFLGGYTGSIISDILTKKQIKQLTVNTHGSTRICTTLITHEMTEIIEPSDPISVHEKDQLTANFLTEVENSSYGGIAIMGSYPPGIPDDYYKDIVVNKKDKLVLLDCYRGITKVLETNSLDILKINLSEAKELTKIAEIDEINKYLWNTYLSLIHI
eukprot:TRINITY_DN10719_c0_g1_i1.p1 TRINITY_DN10719_c0_g1~~TRINITY_DN10719_c0_g1_i1.p1  ORF type:complete len:216 (-),score=29.68 TRINITY_DN10719_c0_g1_i1:17-664(-)